MVIIIAKLSIILITLVEPSGFVILKLENNCIIQLINENKKNTANKISNEYVNACLNLIFILSSYDRK